MALRVIYLVKCSQNIWIFMKQNALNAIFRPLFKATDWKPLYRLQIQFLANSRYYIYTLVLWQLVLKSFAESQQLVGYLVKPHVAQISSDHKIFNSEIVKLLYPNKKSNQAHYFLQLYAFFKAASILTETVLISLTTVIQAKHLKVGTGMYALISFEHSTLASHFMKKSGCFI